VSKSKSSEYPQLVIRVSQFEFKRFQTLKENGLSARKVLEHICEKCPCDLIIPNKDGYNIEIPNKLLSKKKH